MIQEKIGHIIDLVNQGLIPEALVEFNVVRKQSPFDIDLIKAEMMVRLEHNVLDNFLEVVLEFHQQNQSVDSKFLLAYFYFSLGNIQESIKLFQELREFDDSSHAYLSFWIACAMASKSDKTEIEAAIRTYTTNYPTNIEFLLYASAVCNELKLANLKSELQQKLDTFDPELVNNLLESNINSILN